MNYIAVVEDSAQDRAVLDSYLEKYQQEKNCHFQITHFSDGEVHSTGSMRDVEQKLPPENFFRSSKAYLVNLEHVDGIQDEDAIVNGERVQISRAKRKAFLAALNHYMGETI